MDDKKVTNTVFELLSRDKIKESISLLKKYISSSEDLKMLIVQSARYTDIVKQIHLGTVEEITSSIEKNKIRVALIELASEIEEQIENSPKIESHLKRKSINQMHYGKGDNVAGDKIINK